MLSVDYVTEPAAVPHLLGLVGFGDGGIPIRQLGPETLVERWCGEDVVFGALSTNDDDPERAARSLYADVLRTIAESGHPHLLRIWNHVRGINGGDGEAERYKSFCAGRHEAFAAAGWPKERFPAASAVGMRSGGLAIYYLAARTPGVNVENPRQVSAYDYPPLYGRRSPSFARATLFGETLFIAGTSSVVGHETRHEGDVGAQLDETLVNLEAVAKAAGGSGLADLDRLKIYLRRAGDYAIAATRLREAMPHAHMLFLEADVCRAGLLLEIEAVGRV
jgi:chorismate lyase/3-hydroxybenzoate synthase